jgi:PAS domain S-box-containing protein
MFYKRNSYINSPLSHEEFRIILNSIGDAVITTDRKGNVKAMNHIASEMTGYNEKDAKGKKLESILNILSEISGERIKNLSSKLHEEEKIEGLSANLLLISKDGSRIPVSYSGAPIRDANGEITGVVLVFRDETADRKKQRIIEESERKYRDLFDSTNDGLCLFRIIRDKDGNAADSMVLGSNSRFEALSGEKEEALISRKVSELQDGIHKKRLPAVFGSLKENKKVFFETYNPVTKKYLNINVYPNATESFVMVLQDITERKTSEVRQKALYSVAESMLSSPTISELSNIIIEQLKVVLKNPEIKIELYGDIIKSIPSLSFEGTKYARQICKPVEGSLQSYCLQTGKTLIVDINDIEKLRKEGLITGKMETFKSCLVMPLLSNTVPMATLTICSKEEDAFG